MWIHQVDNDRLWLSRDPSNGFQFERPHLLLYGWSHVDGLSCKIEAIDLEIRKASKWSADATTETTHSIQGRIRCITVEASLKKAKIDMEIFEGRIWLFA